MARQIWSKSCHHLLTESNDTMFAEDAGDVEMAENFQDFLPNSTMITSDSNGSPVMCISQERFDTLLEFVQPRGWMFPVMVLFGAIFLIGVAGNLLVCIAIARYKFVRSVTTVFIASLSISDASVLILCLPLTVIEDLFHSWHWGSTVCKIVKFLQATSIFVTILTLACLAAERYMTICYYTYGGGSRLSKTRQKPDPKSPRAGGSIRSKNQRLRIRKLQRQSTSSSNSTADSSSDEANKKEDHNEVAKQSRRHCRRLKRTEAIVMVIVVWFIAIISAIPELFRAGTHPLFNDSNLFTTCASTWTVAADFGLHMTYLILLFILPLLVICFCYYKILKAIWVCMAGDAKEASQTNSSSAPDFPACHQESSMIPNVQQNVENSHHHRLGYPRLSVGSATVLGGRSGVITSTTTLPFNSLSSRQTPATPPIAKDALTSNGGAVNTMVTSSASTFLLLSDKRGGAHLSTVATVQLSRRLRFVKMLIVICVLFVTSFLPAYTYITLEPFHLLQGWVPQDIDTSVYWEVNTGLSLLVHFLLYFNSVVNPIVYVCMSDKFSRAFRQLLCPATFNRQKRAVGNQSTCCWFRRKLNSQLGIVVDRQEEQQMALRNGWPGNAATGTGRLQWLHGRTNYLSQQQIVSSYRLQQPAHHHLPSDMQVAEFGDFNNNTPAAGSPTPIYLPAMSNRIGCDSSMSMPLNGFSPKLRNGGRSVEPVDEQDEDRSKISNEKQTSSSANKQQQQHQHSSKSSNGHVAISVFS